MVVSWLSAAGIAGITVVAIRYLLWDPYKRRKNSGDGGSSVDGDVWFGGDGGDCGGGGGD
jgi:hypothetical protein